LLLRILGNELPIFSEKVLPALARAIQSLYQLPIISCLYKPTPATATIDI